MDIGKGFAVATTGVQEQFGKASIGIQEKAGEISMDIQRKAGSLLGDFLGGFGSLFGVRLAERRPSKPFVPVSAEQWAKAEALRAPTPYKAYEVRRMAATVPTVVSGVTAVPTITTQDYADYEFRKMAATVENNGKPPITPITTAARRLFR